VRKKIFIVLNVLFLMIKVGVGSSGSKFLKTKYPVTEGLEGGNTKQEGMKETLEPQLILLETKDEVLI